MEELFPHPPFYHPVNRLRMLHDNRYNISKIVCCCLGSPAPLSLQRANKEYLSNKANASRETPAKKNKIKATVKRAQLCDTLRTCITCVLMLRLFWNLKDSYYSYAAICMAKQKNLATILYLIIEKYWITWTVGLTLQIWNKLYTLLIYTNLQTKFNIPSLANS